MNDKPDHKGLRRLGEKWLARIKAAEKREERWMKDAEGAESIYAVNTEDTYKLYDFNILHSNVETIVPAIYNSTPVPDIRDRFRTGDENAKAVSDIYEMIISTQIDDNKLDAEIEAGAQDAFLSGRGIVRIRFDADVEEVQGEFNSMTGEMGAPTEEATNEQISFEAISWRDYREGPARRFEDVAWVAFRHMIPEEGLDDISNADMVSAQERDDKPATSDEDEDDIQVWEIWDKASKLVWFVRASDGTVLDQQEDPMELKGFFPITAPIQPITLTSRRTPVCPFTVYRRLADELDTTTRRINAVLSGLKVKGWIVGNTEDVTQLANAGDNQLVPISGFEGLAQTGGIDKAIVWWPIDKAIQVLRELYVAREQTKQSIYEITGISDIVRGASEAQETLGAQQIKTQWGSLRIKKMQRLIERQVRDLFILSSELIASKFSVKTLQAMTGKQITEEMMQLIKDPLQRYRIDVESDSTVRADLSRVKGELTEFLQGTASYFATMAPVLEQAPEAAEPVADIYAAFGRLFNLGPQGEEAIEKMVEIAKKSGQQERPNPEAEQAKAQMSLEQAKMQMAQEQAEAQMQLDIQSKQADYQLRQQESKSKQAMEVEKMKLEIGKSQIDRDIKGVELQIKERELGIKERQQVIDTQMKTEEIQIEKEQQRAAKVG